MTKQAFSLAEVLITLMIIGVISGMTIPALKKDSMNKIVATNLKKAYSELNQVFSSYLVENYTNQLCRTNIFGGINVIEDEIIYPKFSVINTCSAGSPEKCFGNKNVIGSVKSYLLNSGMAIAFDEFRQEWCPGFYATIYVDVNGPKPPNKGGTDQFVFSVYNSGSVQTSYSIKNEYYRNYAKETCTSASSDYSAAWACAVTIQADGWEVKY